MNSTNQNSIHKFFSGFFTNWIENLGLKQNHDQRTKAYTREKKTLSQNIQLLIKAKQEK